MKKLFVILLAVALTLSLAAMASAATFSPYVGGEFQLTYVSNGDTSPFTLGSGNNSMMKAYVQGKVEDADTNTWAQIGAKLTCWNNAGNSSANYEVKTGDINDDGVDETYVAVVDNDNNFDLLYSAGIKKVGGILDIQFSTDDYEATLRGQTPLNNGAYKFGGDPYFCNRIGNSFDFDVNTDNATVNFGVEANGAVRKMVLAGTAKFDVNKVYVGYAKLSDTDSNMIVGTELKLGFGTVKADYYMVNTGSTVSTFQGNVSFDEAKVAATLMYDMKNRFADEDKNTIGVGVEYSGIEKFTVGAKYFATADASYEVYGIYKLGVLDIRPGYSKEGTANGYFYLAAHVGMW